MHLLRRSLIGIAFVVGASLSSLLPLAAHAAIGTSDTVPSATLLYPYFEVDLGNAAGIDSVLSIQSATATAVLGHVTVWSDEGVVAAVFNVYLTGYDLQSFSMRDVLNGMLPRTASAGQDPGDNISPKGPYSQDINFATCNGILPYTTGAYQAPSGMTPGDLKLALTGQATTGASPGQCWARNLGDNHARGYVTVDTVSSCTASSPGDAGYMTNDITFQNVLNGTYTIIDQTRNYVVSDAAVNIEASPTDPLTTTAGNYTFYGRYDSTPWNAEDRRERLPLSWAVQGETDTSSLLVWRDSKTVEAPHSCSANPAYYPLGQEGFAFFTPDSKYVFGFAPSAPLPVASQLVPFNAASFSTPAQKLGLLYTDLNTTVAAAGSNPPQDPLASQSYIVVSHAGQGGLPTSSSNAAVQSPTQDGAHYLPGNF